MRKAGAWYSFDNDQLGQGREAVKRFLRENPDVAMQLQARVLEAVGLIESDVVDADDEAADASAADSAADDA